MFDLKGFKRVDFPQGFLWGASTSAYQVEGGNTNNQWWAFEQLEGRIERGEKCGDACGHYRKYEEDFDLAQSLKHNIHRLSIEWSRVCPQEGVFDTAELEHYRRVLEALRERGMKVLLTMHHFTDPLWFFEKGSFGREGAEADFAAFCGRCAREYGGLVDYWATFNEPQVNLLGWYWGIFPPEKKDLQAACRVLAGQLKAHAAAREAIKASLPGAQVGMVMATGEFRPRRDSDFLDRLYSDLFDYLWTGSHLEAVGSGWIRYPAVGEDEQVDGLRNSCDFWGVNYYTENWVDSRSPRGLAEPLPGQRVSGMKWTWAPEGLVKSLERYSRQGVPLFVSENGIATDDDFERVRYLVEHLRAVAAALGMGLDVRGYLHWSLLDNFEWACGFRPRFGLVGVDYRTLERKVKPSAEFYAEVIENNALTRELIERYLPEAYRF
ncbi:MAG: glycoside hydrolase family 1 protein [Candidatus Glassbacteria bacterium]|nr:glycoside hydrolase family 1 protein [Candidatus Glassbacteria bacterium]